MVASAHTRNRTPRWRALVTLIAMLGLFGSSTLAVIAQGATPEAGDAGGVEQPVVETTDDGAGDTSGSTEQTGGDTSTGDYTEPDTTIGSTDESSAGTFETTSLETEDSGDPPVVDEGPPILPNTDSIAGGADPAALDPGQQATFDFTYTVTTYRTGTTIVADLRHSDGSIAYGWGLSAQAGGGAWAGGDAVVEVGEWGSLEPGTAFALSVIVTAPASVDAEQSVSLWVNSTASTARGETETGVYERGPLATATVVPQPSEEPAEVVAAVAAEPVVIEEAPVTCDVAEDAAPWIVTDLADYPPGALVTLTGGNWVPGQTIEILVEDDGIADAERGEWSHAATVTADEQGGFTYQFNLAPWYVANYTVVATGECAEASTTFTDGLITAATVNSASQTTVGPSATIAASVTVQLGPSESWSSTGWKVGSGTQGCVALPNKRNGSAQNPQYTEALNITAPSAPGSYDVTFTAYSDVSCTTQTSSATTKTLGGGVNVATPTATAIIAPTSVTAGATNTSLTITVTNTSDVPLGSARIAIPGSFTNVAGPQVTAAPAGKTWTASSIPGFITLAASDNSAARLTSGQAVTVTFTATAPTTTGDYTWTAQADSNNVFASGSFTISPQPTVTVTASECTPSLALTALNFTDPSIWDGSAWSTETGTMGIKVDGIDASCTKPANGWTISAKIEAPLTGPDDSIIPTGNLSYDPSTNGTPPSGIAPETGGGTLDTQIRIATVSTDFESSPTSWNAGFSISPSANENNPVPGTYTGEITITLIDAP